MRKLFIVLMCTFLCTIPAFADDLVDSSTDSDDSTITLDNDTTVNYNNDDVISILQSIADKIPETQDAGIIEIEPSENVELRQLRISASQTSGLHSIFLSLIGDYNPIVKDYTYTSNNGYTSHSIEIQPDYSWLASALLFIVVLFCTFKFLGGIVSNV